jgi:hypothetical protein
MTFIILRTKKQQQKTKLLFDNCFVDIIQMFRRNDAVKYIEFMNTDIKLGC